MVHGSETDGNHCLCAIGLTLKLFNWPEFARTPSLKEPMSMSSRRELNGRENFCTARKEIRKAAYDVYTVTAVNWATTNSSR